MTTYIKRRSTKSEWNMANHMLYASRMQGNILVLTPKQFQQLKTREMSGMLLYISEGPPEGISESPFH